MNGQFLLDPTPRSWGCFGNCVNGNSILFQCNFSFGMCLQNSYHLIILGLASSVLALSVFLCICKKAYLYVHGHLWKDEMHFINGKVWMFEWEGVNVCNYFCVQLWHCDTLQTSCHKCDVNLQLDSTTLELKWLN